LYEITLRIILLYTYGKDFRNKFYSPILKENHKFGFIYSSNFSFKKYKKKIFEKWAYYNNQIEINNDVSDDELNRNLTIFNTDEFGFRNKKIYKSKELIFCIGGSTTACNNCDDNETWPQVLERSLQKKYPNLQIINSGVQAWYSYNNLLKIKLDILKFKPKAIIIHQGWNEEFVFSSLNLGKQWSPNILRNFLDSNIFYKKTGFWPTKNFHKYSYSFFLIKRIFYWNRFFKNMNFSNPERWLMLKKDDYLKNWVNNIKEIVSIANENNIHIFFVDPPCLVERSDSVDDRKIYIESSRLNKWYAMYQSISSYRISLVLEKLNKYIPVIKTKECFEGYTGKDRLGLFHDEIHLTSTGNELLGKFISKKLIQNKNFEKVLSKSILNSSVHYKNINSIDTSNTDLIDFEINQIINILSNSKKQSKKNLIPDDRYTTF
jgi:hypothetical protein